MVPPDIELGPKPLAANLVQINGDGSMLVEYTIQWAMPNPCPQRPVPLAVLAHAWMSSDDLDEQYFLTRTYRGRVHLNPKVVGAAGGNAALNPDQIRGLLLPPRTEGCYRTLGVSILEDGFTVDYQIEDRQPQAFCNSFEVVRIEATQSMQFTLPSAAERLAGWGTAVGALSQATGGWAGRGGGGTPFSPGPPRRGWGGAARNATNVAATTVDMMRGMVTGIPVVEHIFTATAYGNPASRYSELARAARVVCLFRLMRGTLVGRFGLPGAGTFLAYGGAAQQQDSADPKRSTFTLQLRTARRQAERPRCGLEPGP